jgi:hypothetical protein
MRKNNRSVKVGLKCYKILAACNRQFRGAAGLPQQDLAPPPSGPPAAAPRPSAAAACRCRRRNYSENRTSGAW